MSPESCDPNINEFNGIVADIWALGVTMFCMVYNKLPYSADTEFLLMETINKKEIEFPENREVSKDCKRVLMKLMDKDPSKRITLDELLSDEWLVLN